MKKTAKWIAALAVACAVALAGCKVVSEPEPIAVQSVTLNTTTLTLAPGDTDRLSATVLPLNADNRTVTWSSSDRSVASVIYDGTITAEGEGKATITAQAGNQLATCEVTVKHKVVAVSYFTINERSITLDPCARRILTATIYPDNATDKSVTWSSSNPDVATVENNGISDGMITAISPGTAIITAQSVGNGDMVQCLVTVNETEQPDYTVPVEVESITLDAETLTLGLGKKRTLKATVMPWSEGAKTVTWSSSDKTIATVDDDGTVTATFTEGTAIITAQAGDKTAECVVTVQPISVAVESITLNTDRLMLKRGETGKLTATVTPDDADEKTVTWTSEDPDIAAVDNDGTVTTYIRGFTDITAQAGEMTAKCRVIVLMIPIESITLNKTTLFLENGKREQLKYTITPDDVDDKDVIWSSSDETIATVEDGIVTAVKEGKATISVTAWTGDATATCEVTVHNPNPDHNHSYSGGKCTICGANPTMKGGTIDENGVLTEYYGKETTVDIPEGVTGIGNSAFNNCTSLTSVTIPDSVTSIGENAFYNCLHLKKITIPNSVTNIGENAFNQCQSLTNVTIPDSVTSIANSAFYLCSSLKSVTIPNSVTSIADSAFARCVSLASVTIPSSVKSIGKNAFSGCTKLANVTIPANVTSLGIGAFKECTGLTSVVMKNGIKSIREEMFYGCTSLASVTIPNSVTSIADSAFYGCTSLASVDIPTSVTSIGKNAFKNCTSLTSVTIPASVTSFGIGAFRECTGLTTVVLTNGIKSIGEFTFFMCTSLTSVTIPNSVTSIGDSVFRKCTNLASIDIPASVTSIGGEAFSECTSLTSVTIPNSVTSIECRAFYSCTSLTSVTIPASVITIEELAFRSCSSLKTVTYTDTSSKWRKIEKNQCFPNGLYIICNDGECQWDIN